MQFMMYFSQKGQDRWIIEEVFPDRRGGYFVDLAATNGIALSNTFVLEKNLGWTGIAIEPHPAYFAALSKARRCICVQACVDEDQRIVQFVPNGELGGIID